MSGRAEHVAARLAARVAELDRALAAAGAAPEDAQRLLELAAVAAMQAVGLQELAAAGPRPARRSEPAEPEAEPLVAAA